MQKHEIRQVYVRSTARVYEIYYAPTLQSDNEYLCTVRCGIAEKDGEFLQANEIEVVSPQYLKDYVGKPTEGRVTAEAKVCASEDDWVEVKVPDGDRISCLQKHTTGNERRSIEVVLCDFCVGSLFSIKKRKKERSKGIKELLESFGDFKCHNITILDFEASDVDASVI